MTPTKGYADVGNVFSNIALITRAPSDTQREVDDPGREYIIVVQKSVERIGALKRDLSNYHYFLAYKIHARKNQELPQSKSTNSG